LFYFIDISWSDDGKYIATALGVDDDNEKSKIIIYHVKSASSPLSECFSFFASGVLSLRFTRVGLIAASRNKSSDESVTVLLQVFIKKYQYIISDLTLFQLFSGIQF
jgi:hypothetical protein